MGNWFDKNKFFEKLLILTWVVFLFICIGLLSFTSHAESSYFPMNQDDNDLIPDSYYSVFDSYLDAENNYIFIKINLYNTNYHSYYWVTVSKDQGSMIYGEISNNGQNFSLYNSGSGGTYRNGRITFQKSNGAVASFDTYNQNAFTNFSNMPSSLYDTNKAYISNFKLMSNSGENAVVVLKYGADDPEPIGQGHATPPDPFEDPTLATGSNHNLPREVPESPTIINYSWTTYNSPTIDTTNVESLLESLIYVINYLAGWLHDNLAAEFQNLISNITTLINYIGETIQYYGGLIISNIQNGIETFYNNMVSLFEPISAKIDYLTEPVDGTIIYDNISGTSIVSSISTINTSLTAFETSFNNLSEPSSFTIPIHLENLPSAYFGTQTTQYIDLGIIGSTEKGLIRTFMWALVTYSLFITIVDSVSNYINGGGDES